MKKMVQLLAGASIVLLTLSSCGRPGQTHDGAASSTPMETQPTHIAREVNENFRIDADIVAPEAGASVKIYRTELPEINMERVNAFLAAVGDKAVDVEAFTEDGISRINGTTEKSKNFMTQCMPDVESKMEYGIVYSNVFDPNVVDPYTVCVQLEDPINPYDAQVKSRWINTDLYTQPRELACGTVDEAEQLVAQIMEALQVSGDLEFRTVLYLDHKTMNEAYESDFIKTVYERGGQEVPKMEPATEEDDTIALFFGWNVDGIPICGYPILTSTEAFWGTQGSAFINKDGLDSLTFARPLQPVEALEEVSVLSGTEACDIAEELIGSLADHNRILLCASLEYYPTQDRGQWVLKPIWTFTVQVKDYFTSSDGTTADEVEYYFVDAVTGDEI